MTKPSSINLLKKEERAFDKFIVWILTVGRIILIFVEAVVIGALLYRMPLDMKISDLKDETKSKQRQVNAAEKEETLYRSLQSRLDVAAGVEPVGNKSYTFLNILTQLPPVGVTYTEISIEGSKFTLNVDAQSPTKLRELIQLLQKNSAIQTASIIRIENKPASGIIKADIVGIAKL